jgi:hypothetical protein
MMEHCICSHPVRDFEIHAGIRTILSKPVAIFTALQEQLRLKLEPSKGLVEAPARGNSVLIDGNGSAK